MKKKLGLFEQRVKYQNVDKPGRLSFPADRWRRAFVIAIPTSFVNAEYSLISRTNILVLPQRC